MSPVPREITSGSKQKEQHKDEKGLPGLVDHRHHVTVRTEGGELLERSE